jgi:hypothetical protein
MRMSGGWSPDALFKALLRFTANAKKKKQNEWNNFCFALKFEAFIHSTRLQFKNKTRINFVFTFARSKFKREKSVDFKPVEWNSRIADQPKQL